MRYFLYKLLEKVGWNPLKAVPLSPLMMALDWGWEDEEDIKSAITKVKEHTMVTFERLASLWHQVCYLDRYKIAGDLVECGVWRGGCAGMMALAHLSKCTPPNRRLHLFDSFQGLPHPLADQDGSIALDMARQQGAGLLLPINRCVVSAEDCRDLINARLKYPLELTSIHPGWFEETLPAIVPDVGPIALLRLDGDWYRSTKICLDYLYPKVVQGGVVVIDDFGHWEGCAKAVNEFLADHAAEPIFLNHVDYSCRSWVKLAK